MQEFKKVDGYARNRLKEIGISDAENEFKNGLTFSTSPDGRDNLIITYCDLDGFHSIYERPRQSKAGGTFKETYKRTRFKNR